jgi:hypothetical protein
MVFKATERLDFKIIDPFLMKLRTDAAEFIAGQSYHLRLVGEGLLERHKTTQLLEPKPSLVRAYSISSPPGASDEKGLYIETLIALVDEGGRGPKDVGAFTFPLYMLAHSLVHPDVYRTEILPQAKARFDEIALPYPAYLEDPSNMLKLEFSDKPYGDKLMPLDPDAGIDRIMVGPGTGIAPFLSILGYEAAKTTNPLGHKTLLLSGVPYGDAQADAYRWELEGLATRLDLKHLTAISREAHPGVAQVVQQFWLPADIAIPKKEIYALPPSEYADLVINHINKAGQRSLLPVEVALGCRLGERPLAGYACGLKTMTNQMEALYARLPNMNEVRVEGY